MTNVVNFPLSRRCMLPALPEGGPELSVNLDAVGRLGALLCQIAALQPASSLPDGYTAQITRHGVCTEVLGDQATATAEALMDAKDELVAALGDGGPCILRTCLDALCGAYAAANA